MSKWSLLRTLNDLSHGEFGSRTGQESFISNDILVESPIEMAIEFDGEVLTGKTFRFGIAPDKLNFMT